MSSQRRIIQTCCVGGCGGCGCDGGSGGGGAVKYSSKYGKYCIVGGDYERSRTAMEFVVL